MAEDRPTTKQRVCEELLTTEEQYVAHLGELVHGYLEPISRLDIWAVGEDSAARAAYLEGVTAVLHAHEQVDRTANVCDVLHALAQCVEQHYTTPLIHISTTMKWLGTHKDEVQAAVDEPEVTPSRKAASESSMFQILQRPSGYLSFTARLATLDGNPGFADVTARLEKALVGMDGAVQAANPKKPRQSGRQSRRPKQTKDELMQEALDQDIVRVKASSSTAQDQF